MGDRLDRIRVSSHAVDRFIVRCRPDLDMAAARQLLHEAVGRAAPLKDRTIRGQEQWLLGDLGAILVCRCAAEDRRLLVAVTTLAAEAPPDDDALLQEVLDDLERRRQAERPKATDAAEVRASKELSLALLKQEVALAQAERARIQALAQAERTRIQAELNQEKTRRIQALAQAAVERERLKTERHHGHQEDCIEQLKQALRTALRGLMTGDVEGAKARLSDEGGMAGFLDVQFWGKDERAA